LILDFGLKAYRNPKY